MNVKEIILDKLTVDKMIELEMTVNKVVWME
jgi:hypothetical protein